MSRLGTVLLLLGLGLPAAAQEAEPVPAVAPVGSASPPFLLDPFASPRNSGFYTGLGQPLLRPAALPPAGTLEARLRLGATQTTFGGAERLDGRLWEWGRLELALTPCDWLQLYATARIAGWDERRDVFRIYDAGHTRLVIQGEQRKASFGEATSRHDNLADVALGAVASPLRLGPLALGLGFQAKSPGFRREDVTSNGTTDLAPFLALSLDLHGRVRLHLNAGPVIPLGETWIDERAFAARAFFSGAAGVSWAPLDWLALGASVEGATVAFQDVPALERPAITGSLGVRLVLGRFEAELGLGTGFTAHSADVLGWIELGWRSRPLW